MIKRRRVKPSEYLINGDTCTVVVYGMKDIKRGEVLIDTKDVAKCQQLKWFVKKRKGISLAAITRIDHKLIRMHHFLFGMPPDELEYDHINRNPLDNRKSNLRLCTFEQNQWNQNNQRTNTSGYKGVVKCSSGKNWFARITVKGKEKYLGCFDNKILAAEAYNKAVEFYRDKYAYRNNACMGGA